MLTVLGNGKTWNVQKLAQLDAAMTSARLINERMAKARVFKTSKSLREFALQQCQKRGEDAGLYLEFGVATGKTIKQIAARTSGTVYGFDSFDGLPEDWNDEFRKGAFKHPIPDLPDNVVLKIGLFENTLPDFCKRHHEPIRFLHVDCDLYSSTKTIFQHIGHLIEPGTIIVFDEYFNYCGWQQHEFKAFEEFLAQSGLRCAYLGYVSVHQQVCVRIVKAPRRKKSLKQRFLHILRAGKLS